MKFQHLFFLLLFVFEMGVSQESTSIQRPKVGLVLSGGGAKGFAHIGVLKELEKANVKIDYIGGTSMGAVIGGLYATGYTANEIDSIIHAINFNNFLQDILPRSQTTFFEKKYGEKHLLTFPIKNKKISLPKAIATGQSLYNLLNSLFAHVSHITEFDKLPIPFFCMATNLESGKAKIFDDGYLTTAIRASASLPTLLEPIEIEGVAYIDGGVSNNFPVEEMKKKGATIIIGVDVQGELSKKENINSVIDVLNQIINYQMYAKDDEKIKQLDIHISPDVRTFSVTSFGNVTEIIDVGEKIALESKEAFEKIALLQAKSRKEQRKTIQKKKEKIEVSKITMNSLKHYSRAYILGKLKLETGDSISYDELNRKIGGLSSSKDFNLIQYKFKTFQNNKQELELDLKENTISSFVKLGLHYDPLYKSGLLLNFTAKHLLQKNDILSTDFIFGDNLRFNLNYFVDNGFYTSYGLTTTFNKFDTEVNYDGVEVRSINKVYLDFTSLAYIQTTYNKKFAVGLGLEYKVLELYTRALNTIPLNRTTFFEKSNYLNSLLYAKLDTYDRSFSPREGIFVDGEFKWYMNSSDYNNNFTSFSQLQLKFGAAKTFFKKLTTHFITEGGTTMGGNTSGQFQYSLGGYGNNLINNHIQFYGYEFEDLENHSYLMSSLELRYEFVKRHTLAFTGNYARTDLNLFNGEAIFKDIKSGYAFTYGYNSVLGPVKVVHSWSPDENNRNWYFSLGLWF